MARSTFDGPILSGTQRFGNFRNVGYVDLVQTAALNIANTTANTAGYGGSSGIFIASNGIPNSATTVYTPSTSTTYTATSIPADCKVRARSCMLGKCSSSTVTTMDCNSTSDIFNSYLG
jgi:hypothetical protein